MSKTFHSHNPHDHDAHAPNNVANHEYHNHIDYSSLQNNSISLLKIVICLTFGFAIIEVIGGYLFNSLALISDAAHMFTDASSLIIALVMAYFAKIPADHNHSYGHGRAEVIGALFNSLFMFVVIGFIAWEAFERFSAPSEVKSVQMLIVASIGLIINVGVFYTLSKDNHNINIKAALLHVIGDLLGSVAAIIAAVVIYFTGWNLIDPILSLIISIILIPSTYKLLKRSIHILAEGVPVDLDFYEVGQTLNSVEQFESVHDLHIWTLDSKNLALSAHVDIKDMSLWSEGLKNAQKILFDKYKILHVTLQPEIINPEQPKKPLIGVHNENKS
jgi:cobalt-zinc-cadmium efflux system protein